MSLKLEMPVIRELLSREEMQVVESPSDSPAMATGEATVEFLSACCRLMDLLSTPQDIPFLSGLIQSEIIYRILRGPEGTRLRAIATLGDQSHRTAKAIAWIKANYAKPLRVEDLVKIAGMGKRTPEVKPTETVAPVRFRYSSNVYRYESRKRSQLLYCPSLRRNLSDLVQVGKAEAMPSATS
jgi:hypothetical protein